MHIAQNPNIFLFVVLIFPYFLESIHPNIPLSFYNFSIIFTSLISI